jgi:hypothetical protein
MILAVGGLALLAACGADQAPPTVIAAPPQPPTYAGVLAAPAEAVHSADIARIDPAKLTGAEIRAVLGAGPLCRFRYSQAGPPVLAFRRDEASDQGPSGVVKLNGRLVALSVARAQTAVSLHAEGIAIDVTPARAATADMRISLREGLRVGYRGAYACDAA